MWVDDVLEFWFNELEPENWFAKDEQLDARIRERFSALHESLRLDAIAVPETPRGHLAAIIVLDRFSRNLHRGSPMAFASDARALALAQHALAQGYDRELTKRERKFLYMPFMHSEDKHVQARCVELFSTIDDADALRYAIEHRDIVDRFGRFPHRNPILGRDPTPEEAEFMKHHEGF
jgi:uncharacterized protein (DUF924 family)